jgi:GGDEF domain-containing protein
VPHRAYTSESITFQNLAALRPAPYPGLSVAAADARIQVTVSIGVAVLGQPGSDLFELLAAADVALYRAKDAGRDQVRVYAHAASSAKANARAAETKDEATGTCP